MDVAVSNYKPRKWYNRYIFPLVPVFTTREANEHNTSGFSFDWLFIKIWSRDSIDLEFAFVLSEHWGIGITALLPYLRIVVCIPCPPKLGIWCQKNLWRKAACDK